MRLSRKLSFRIVCTFLQFMTHVAGAADLSPLQLAKAAKISYERKPQFNTIDFTEETYRNSIADLTPGSGTEERFVELSHYPNTPTEIESNTHGIQAVTLVNETQKLIIISFRGTDTDHRGNLLIDAGIAALGDQGELQNHVDQYSRFFGGELFGTTASWMYYFGNWARWLAGNAIASGPQLLDLLNVASALSGNTPEINTLRAAIQNLRPGAELAQSSQRQLGQIAINLQTRLNKNTQSAVDHATEYLWTTLRDFSESQMRRALDSDEFMLDSTKIEILTSINLTGEIWCPPADYQLYITGHSLGGFLAQIAGHQVLSFCRQVDPKKIRVVTFNAPGAKKFIETYKYKGTNPTLGSLLEKIGEVREAINEWEIFQYWPLSSFKWAKLEVSFVNYHRKNDVVGTFLHPVGTRISLLDFHNGPLFEPFYKENAKAIYEEAKAAYQKGPWWMIPFGGRRAGAILPPTEADKVFGEMPKYRKKFAFTQSAANLRVGKAAYFLINHGIDGLVDDLKLIPETNNFEIPESFKDSTPIDTELLKESPPWHVETRREIESAN